MIYEIYGKLHHTAKKIMGRTIQQKAFRMVSVNDENLIDGRLIEEGPFFNDITPGREIKKNQVYPIENIVPAGEFLSLSDSFKYTNKYTEKKFGVGLDVAEKYWNTFVNNSLISGEYRNAGFHYAGFILDFNEWCLPSWIWTNAALVRMFCNTCRIEEAKELANNLIFYQQDCGGWIVRNDYDSKGAVPVLAPNDSAYIANNGCLEVYLATNEKKYLEAAERCAEWIMNTAREDGMVYVGYNTRDNQWQTKHNIVDVGFTAALFARLYEVTNKNKYKVFLSRFTKKYIDLFYNPSTKGFTTSLDANNQQIGGMFGRGQAWALEGLIPAYRVLLDDRLKEVIDNTVSLLLRLQNKNGGWAYNLTKPLMGIDCKATPIIALSIINWNTNKETMLAAKKALDWIICHTSNTGKSLGGIFSYTIEGAIVHHMYTCTAFVYSSAYAIEFKKRVASFDLY